MLFNRKVLLGNYWEPLARQEDQWDDLMERSFDLPAKMANEPRWLDAVATAQDENNTINQRYLEEDRVIAKKMQDLVKEETKLALSEGRPVQRGRKGRHRPKKLFP
jgi:hypothetical protein